MEMVCLILENMDDDIREHSCRSFYEIVYLRDQCTDYYAKDIISAKTHYS